MKSYCKNLVVSRAHVAAAYGLWEKGLAGHKNTYRVVEEYGSASALIDEITREIATRTLTFTPVHRYQRVEPTNGKVRIIGVQSVKQQVCDYLVVSLLQPLLDAKLGFYQASSTKGKGQLFVARTLRRWSHRGGYWVQLDVKQCYPSIKHDLVMRILSKRIRSEDVLYLAGALLATYEGGLDIGSYFSLRMAQLVLSFAYHHVEGLGKIRRGRHQSLVTHQIWYMDDAVLLGSNKRDLRRATRSLQRYMRAELGLTIKPWKICRVGEDEPINLAGFMVRPGRTTIRGATFLRARQAIRRFQRRPTLTRALSVCSYWGWFKHSSSRRVIANNHMYEAVRDARRLIAQHSRRNSASYSH